ncbi:hypothetical protein C2S52_012010 [Perilla frutescens var. hirtella]|nr:hypothetical protein C2S52_012010 [Perilla frutescens var. hirtella]
MANAAATENCFVDGDLNVDEFSNIDSSLLMSLLDEEGGDDEMLRSMIESLEPGVMNQDSCSETDNSDDASSEDFGFSRSEVDDQLECCSTSPDHHPDFDQWIDMEMAYSCPSYEMTGYFIGRFTGNMVDLEGLQDYSSQVCYDEMPMEEDDYIGLWQ